MLRLELAPQIGVVRFTLLEDVSFCLVALFSVCDNEEDAFKDAEPILDVNLILSLTVDELFTS
jgi:hypothetical protein